LFGRHLSDYLSVQATYGWNRNSLTLTSSQSSADRGAFYEQTRSATQHAAVGELLLYFRRQGRSVRPYLSVGGGAIHVTSSEKTIRGMIEEGIAAPGGFSSTKPALRVAVGIDLFIKGRMGFPVYLQRNHSEKCNQRAAHASGPTQPSQLSKLLRFRENVLSEPVLNGELRAVSERQPCVRTFQVSVN